MNQEEYKEYLKSSVWWLIRDAMRGKRGYKCEKCGVMKDLEVHHKHYDMELGREKEEDLMVLCDECHNSLHMDLECFN